MRAQKNLIRDEDVITVQDRVLSIRNRYAKSPKEPSRVFLLFI
jgi:hypothetical protein